MATPQALPDNFRHLVRIVNTDLDGRKPLAVALAKIRGVGIPLGYAIARLAHIDPNHRVGTLTDAQVKKLDDIVRNPAAAGVPVWQLNHRKDIFTGQDKHLVGADLQFATEQDIKLMKDIKSYKGVRHMLGAPVRGQRTRSHFRKNKGKVSLGVRVTAKKTGTG
jgi:small subunit ribosomal protein S13